MKIENQKLNIDEAFNNFFYFVPEYQREFVWAEEHVSKFLEDISDEFENNRNSEYFIGSVVVNRNGSGSYEVIDGQQRLTTIFLTLCAFKSLLGSKKDYLEYIRRRLFSSEADEHGEISQRIRLTLQYEDCSAVLNVIMEEKEYPAHLSASSERIKEAYSFVSNYLASNYKNDSLIPFYGYFIKKVSFIQIETPSISDALKIFETINERGVGLNPLDLLKNLIFRQLDRARFGHVNSDWKKIIGILEKNKQKPLRFLRYFLMANYHINDEKRTEVIREDEIYNWITRNEDQCKYTNAPFEFVAKIQRSAERYVNFASGRDSNGKNVYLENIRNLGGASFSQHLVLLLAGANLEPLFFNYLARQLENLIFYYTVSKTPTKILESRFSLWAKELKKIETIKGDKRDAINDFVNKYLIQETKQLEGALKLQFLNLEYGSLQKYKLKYILAKICQYVDAERIGQKEALSLDPYLANKIEIEHILPDKPEPELLATFPNKEKYDELKLKLGNLTLLEKPINVVAGRKFFEKKQPLYKSCKFYLTKSIAEIDDVGKENTITRMNQRLIHFDKWDEDSINRRQQMLWELARSIWAIELIH